MKQMKEWAFITNHGLVLLYVSQNPECTAREMASAIDATERTVHRVLADLQREGYVIRQRTGRGNIYQVNHARTLRHPFIKTSLVDDLLHLAGQENAKEPKAK